MKKINFLGIIVVFAVLIIVGGAYASYRFVSINSVQKNEVGTVTPRPPDASAVAPQNTDRDNDGLHDLVENIYKTDPSLADTDGDGTSDGDEISLGRDPLIPAPNDSIRDIIADDPLNSPDTYTQQYLAQLPPDLTQDEILTPEALETYVDQETATGLLPDISEQDIVIRDNPPPGEEGSAIETYLDAISPTTNEDITAVTSEDISRAFEAYYADPKTVTVLDDVIAALEQNKEILAATPVPQQAVDLHLDLVRASTALYNNVVLLKTMPGDYVAGLIAAKNIELLTPVFEDVASQIVQLETTYSIE